MTISTLWDALRRTIDGQGEYLHPGNHRRSWGEWNELNREVYGGDRELQKGAPTLQKRVGIEKREAAALPGDGKNRMRPSKQMKTPPTEYSRAKHSVRARGSDIREPHAHAHAIPMQTPPGQASPR